jgi:hypothetical protein
MVYWFITHRTNGYGALCSTQKFSGLIASLIKIQKLLDFSSATAILTITKIHITSTTSDPVFGLSHKESGARER